jgi:hypothetical protein
MSVQCSLSGVKQTSRCNASTSVFDPYLTSTPPLGLTLDLNVRRLTR